MMREAFTLELRVLNGRHAGACAAARDGALIGKDEEADIILSDLDSRAGMAQLHLLGDGRWLLWPAGKEPGAEAFEHALDAGAQGHWGGLALSVSPSQTDWPPLPVPKEETTPDESETGFSEGSESAESLKEEGVSADATTSPDRPEAAEELGPELAASGAQVRMSKEATAARTFKGGRTAVVAGVVVLLAAIVASVIYFFQGGFGQPATESSDLAADPPSDLTDQARRQIPDLALAVAQVDPALRLELQPLRNGRVQVLGWVESVPQLDRLAEALGMRRPAPLLRVFVADNVRTELRAQLSGRLPHLDFQPGAAGILRVRGVVVTEADEAAALNAVRPLLPPGVELASELRLASTLASEVRAVIAGAGFEDASAQWDGEQMVVTLTLADHARGELENALLAAGKRFAGLPLRVKPVAATPAQLAARSRPPFPIRSVVGGAVPYIVLPDGSKLSAGGSHAGWRLQAIEKDLLVFDAPRRLEVPR